MFIRRIRQAIKRIRLLRSTLLIMGGLVIFQLPNIRLFPLHFLMGRIPRICPRRLFPILSLMGYTQRICPRILKECTRFGILLRNSR